MTLDAGRLRGEAARRIEELRRNARTEEDRLRAEQVANLILRSLECRLRAATALEQFEQARARLWELRGSGPCR